MRRGDDFGRAMGAEGADDVNHEGGLKNGKIIGDGWPADLARTRKPRCFEDAPALGHQKFLKFLKGVPSLQPEQFLIRGVRWSACSSHSLFGRLNQDIDISRRPGRAVKRQRVGADDEVFNFVLVE